MSYVVQWVPRGPNMSVACRTLADAIELAAELRATGHGGDLRVVKDDEELDIDAFISAAPETR